MEGQEQALQLLVQKEVNESKVHENMLFPTAVQGAARVRWRRKALERPGRRKPLSGREQSLAYGTGLS